MQTLLSGFMEYSQTKACYRKYCQLWDQYFSTWTQHPSFAEIEAWHRGLLATPHHANKALSLLKAMYTWALRRGLYEGRNPAEGVPAHGTTERDRFMDNEEVRRLRQGMDAHLLRASLLPPSQYRESQQLAARKLVTLLQVLLLTGSRLGEALRMEWTHIDFDRGTWLQPKTKNKRPHITYLARQVRPAIASLPRVGPYVFMGAYQHHWSNAGADKPWRKFREEVQLADVHLHDFRRTLGTHLYKATGSEYLVSRCLNHRKKTTTRIYIKITFEDIATALQAQADRWEALLVPSMAVRYTRRASDQRVEVLV